MASRKEQKQQAREARLAAEQAALASVARRRRLRVLGGVVVLAVIVVGVAIAISAGGGGGGGGLAKRGAAKQVHSQVDALLAGIPEHGETLGKPRAKYTLTFFGDLQCPVCAAFATGANVDGQVGGFPQFIHDQVRTGQAKVVYRSFCTATCNDFGQSLFNTQQVAAYAAGKQDRFWYYEELFYRQQGAEGTPYVTPSFLRTLARQTPGLQFGTWSTDRGDPSLLSQVGANGQAAVKQLPLTGSPPSRGTPGLIMSGPKGSTLVGEQLVDYGQLQAAMKTVS